MATVDIQIASNTGDGYEYGPDLTWVTDGFDLDGWALGRNIAANLYCDAGLVFTNVTVPNGATIDVAYLEIYNTWDGGGLANLPIVIKGFDEDNAALFAADGTNRPSTRTKTTTTVSQTFGTVTTGAFKRLDSIVTIVQEIVDRAGFTSGNNIGFVIEEGSLNVNERGQFSDYNYSSANAAKLHIEYTTSAGAVIPVFMNQYRQRR